MNIKEAKKVISNMQLDGNHISCTLCIFEDERKCVDNNVDCQMKAIETVLAELEKKEKRISDLEFALMDMVLQFADESKENIGTMGLSALEIAFAELNFDNPMPIKEVHNLYKKLAQEYYKQE